MTVLTTYYNPCNWKSRRENYHRFKEELGHNLLTIEVAFGNESHTLKDSVKLRAENPLWVKERALKIGEYLLPKEQDYVCFLDADLIMHNPKWLETTRKLLKEYKTVQPFQQVHRRFRDWSIEKSYNSFGYQYSKGVRSDDFEYEGHPGFAFACRRECFDLYDKQIAGTGDTMLYKAITGQHRTQRIYNCLREERLNHYLEWADNYYKNIQGSLHYTEGEISHLWHGAIENRKYHDRMKELDKLKYNPYTDVGTNDDGLLQLNRKDIQKWVGEYLLSRKEDE